MAQRADYFSGPGAGFTSKLFLSPSLLSGIYTFTFASFLIFTSLTSFRGVAAYTVVLGAIWRLQHLSNEEVGMVSSANDHKKKRP